MKVYVASPLGFFDAGRAYLVTTLHPALASAGHELLDPWELPPHLGGDLDHALTMPLGIDQREQLAAVNHRMGERNARLIESSDALLAVLDGPDVDSGTASEIGYAAALAKRIVGLRTDFRLSADNLGSVVNLQVEFFIHMSGGVVETRLEAALARLTRDGT